MPSIATEREQNQILLQQNQALREHLSAIIESPAIDIDKITSDCIAKFNEYKWERHPSADKELFEILHGKLRQVEGGAPDLANFVTLVKLTPGSHPAAWLYSSEALVTAL